MNLPNRITLLRVIMVPVLAVLMLLCPLYPYLKWAVLAVFILASVTDAIDGKLARKMGLVTNFGKFMDPLADKLLVCTALILLEYLSLVHPIVVIVIVAREFIISGFRLIAAEKGVVLAASNIAKAKTAVQMVMICVLIADLGFLKIPSYVLMGLAVILTVWSLVDYIVKNRSLLKGEM